VIRIVVIDIRSPVRKPKGVETRARTNKINIEVTLEEPNTIKTTQNTETEHHLRPF